MAIVMVVKCRKDERFLLYSTMDNNYLDLFHTYEESKKNYSHRHNYTYISNLQVLKVNTTLQHPVKWRIKALRQLLSGIDMIPQYPWIVYADADAIIAEAELPLTTLTTAASWFQKRFSNIDSYDCHFIIQQYPTFVNSGVIIRLTYHLMITSQLAGFWLIKNSSWSLDFAVKWENEFDRLLATGHIEKYLHDQGALMYTILRIAYDLNNKTYNEEECMTFDRIGHMGKCWSQKLDELNYFHNKRKIGHICLLPQDEGLPFRHHTHASFSNHRYPGEFTWHSKRLSEDMIRGAAKLQYNVDNDTVIFPDGAVIKHHQYNNKAVYLIQNMTRRRFPDFQTFVNMKYDISDIMPLSQEWFNALPEGPFPT